MNIRIVFVSLFLLTSGYLQAQVQFEAKVSKDKLGVNERLRVDFEMNEDGDNFRPPSFEGFTVVGGPNQSVSHRFVNGKRSYSKTYSFFLQPNSRGEKSIGQAEVTIDDKVYKTSPIEIEVTAAVEQPTDGNDARITASDNLHLVAEVSKAHPYLNEAITVVYKLYVSPSISVSDWREMDSPKFTDFWSQNIDIKQLRVENGEFRGEPYRYVELRKTILYPQKTGELSIEPLTLSISVDVPGERRDLFGRRIYKTIEQTVSSGRRTINVKPLPQEGRPADFSGAVGKFNLEVSTNKQQLEASESLEAKVEVRGNGNLKLFDLPNLQVPSSLEVYEPERRENVNTNLQGMQGSISETYTIVPTVKGDFSIAPLNFSYFDPKAREYRRLSSEEIGITVEGAPLVSTGASGSTSSGRQRISRSSDQFRYIKLSTRLRPIGATGFFNSLAFWGAVSLPILAVPLLILFGRKRKAMAGDVSGIRIKRANKLARRYLSEARKKLGQQKEFYEALERAMHNYLKARLHIQTSEMSKERILELLEDRQVDKTVAGDFISLLESCEFARYTPASQSTMELDYRKAIDVISTLDKQL